MSRDLIDKSTRKRNSRNFINDEKKGCFFLLESFNKHVYIQNAH
jgi:hypothetical protein